MEKDIKKDMPDLGLCEYEIKYIKTDKGEEVESFSFKKKENDKIYRTGFTS